jgi:hypothetical protein
MRVCVYNCLIIPLVSFVALGKLSAIFSTLPYKLKIHEGGSTGGGDGGDDSEEKGEMTAFIGQSSTSNRSSTSSHGHGADGGGGRRTEDSADGYDGDFEFSTDSTRSYDGRGDDGDDCDGDDANPPSLMEVRCGTVRYTELNDAALSTCPIPPLILNLHTHVIIMHHVPVANQITPYCNQITP